MGINRLDSYTITCDNCDDEVFDYDRPPPYLNLDDAEGVARQHRWMKGDDGGYTCPKCSCKKRGKHFFGRPKWIIEDKLVFTCSDCSAERTVGGSDVKMVLSVFLDDSEAWKRMSDA